MNLSVLGESLEKFSDLIKKPGKFLEESGTSGKERGGNCAILTKVLYDYSKMDSQGDLNVMDTLHISGFNEQQIWAGVELLNKNILEKHLQETRDLIHGKYSFNVLLGQEKKKKRKLIEEQDLDDDDLKEIPIKKVHFQQDEERDLQEEDDLLGGEQDDDDDDEEQKESEEKKESDEEEEEDFEDYLKDPDFAHMSDSDGDDLPLFENAESEEEESDEESDDEERKAKESEAERKTRELDEKADDYLANAMKTLKKHNQVDDQFFKLAEMEKFLEVEDQKFDRKRNDDEDEEEDYIDYFQEEQDQDVQDNAMYHDYFNQDLYDNKDKVEEDDNKDDDEDEDEEDMEVDGDESPKKKLDIFDQPDSSSDDDSEDEGGKKSNFEERQQRLKDKIKKMEIIAVGEKPWQMTGEIAGPERPENSLLQEHLDYDSVNKQAPIITEEVSKRLDDIIKQRIKDKAWDDVERKIKPVEDPYEYKKKLILDQEKSKLSLAEVYEREYLEKQGKADENSNVKSVSLLDKDDDESQSKEIEIIKRDMKDLFAKLDALTHYHYTPRSVNAEVKIIRNTPTISMEEVAPIGVSDATLLAPQELADKKRGVEIGSTEKTQTDSKRARRKKKHHQKLKAKENENKKDISSKSQALKDLKDAEKKGEKVTTVKDNNNKSVKSSTAFFDKLQTEIVTGINEKRNSKSNKKKNKGLKSAQFKL